MDIYLYIRVYYMVLLIKLGTTYMYVKRRFKVHVNVYSVDQLTSIYQTRSGSVNAIGLLLCSAMCSVSQFSTTSCVLECTRL